MHAYHITNDILFVSLNVYPVNNFCGAFFILTGHAHICWLFSWKFFKGHKICCYADFLNCSGPLLGEGCNSPSVGWQKPWDGWPSAEESQADC